MATVRRETIINADPADVWDAVRDVGALHTRVAPGVVVDTVLDTSGDHLVRMVTFASGQELRERIVAVDDGARRLVWSIEGAPVLHHNGALQVQALGAGQARVLWTADVLPDALAESFAPLMEAGLAAMTTHLQD